MSAALLALLFAASPAEDIKVVIAPPIPPGADKELSFSAWQSTVRALREQATALRLDFSLHEEAAAVLEQEYEQAWQCDLDDACLFALGETFGAELLITGRFDRSDFMLIALDVLGKQRWTSVSGADEKTATEALVRRASEELTAHGSWVDIFEAKKAPPKDASASDKLLESLRAKPAEPPPPPEPEPEPEKPAVVATAPVSEKKEEESSSSWWFWIVVVLAAGAGGATAALLSSGGKGGPSVDPENGTISGTY